MIKSLILILELFFNYYHFVQPSFRTSKPLNSAEIEVALKKMDLLQPIDTSSMVIDRLEIMKNDFEVSMYLPEAQKIVKAKGQGWRVPTIYELNILYKNRDKIGGFSTDRNIDETIYMSTTEENNDGGKYRLIKVLDFSDGNISWGYYARGPEMKVRFVRTIKN